MTTAFDTRMYDLGGRLLAKYGTAATITTGVGQTKTVTTSAKTGLPTTHSVRISPPAPIDSKLVDGDTVLADDLLVVLARKGCELVAGSWVDVTFVPEARSMTLTLDGTTYAIEGVDTYQSGDDVAAWGLRLRRS